MTDRKRAWLALAVVAGIVFFIGLRQRATSPDSAAVVAQVQQLNQLATVRYTVQKVVGMEEQKQPVGSEKILLVMQATVEAGVDLSSLTPRDVERRSDGTLVLRLPPARILHVSVDDKETRVWDRQKTWWTPWVPYSVDLEKKARLEGLEAVKTAALRMGILKQAERNAEAAIRGLLQLAGVRVVIVPASVS